MRSVLTIGGIADGQHTSGAQAGIPEPSSFRQQSALAEERSAGAGPITGLKELGDLSNADRSASREKHIAPSDLLVGERHRHLHAASLRDFRLAQPKRLRSVDNAAQQYKLST
jgi:hypothetical protein